MQKLSTELVGKPVYSVQSGELLGILTGFILQSGDLKMVAFTVKVASSQEIHYLLPGDIRYFNAQKILIDSLQNLSVFVDLVRHQHAITENYNIIGKKVETSSGKKLGKVVSFLFDPAHYYVTKINVSPPILQRILTTSLLIARADIVETKAKVIIVKENLAKIKKTAPVVLPQGN